MTLVIGVDPHKQTHTAAAVNSGSGELVDERTAAARPAGYGELLALAQVADEDRLWALEDVRGVSRGLERYLLSRGERVVRVPPKLMAGARKSARAYGKSDSIDALAIARAALAHPDLPAAEDDRRARDLQLLVSHRETLVRQRSEAQDRCAGSCTRSSPNCASRLAPSIARSGSTGSHAAWPARNRTRRCGSPVTSCAAAVS